MAPQKTSQHGRILGSAFADIADKLAPLHPEVPDRCKTCAYRHGTIPNAMAGTLVEALNCTLGIDPNPFGCHHTLKDGKPTELCAGYFLLSVFGVEEVKAVLPSVVEQLDSLPRTETA